MSDYLEAEKVDECLQSHLNELWGHGKRTIYVQANDAGALEIYGSPALAREVGRRLLDTTSVHQLSSWIAALGSAASPEVAVFAGQNLYAQALRIAVADQWSIEVRRVARAGDCQGSSNYGTDAEQECTRRILNLCESSEPRIALIEVLGAELFFTHANFQWAGESLFESNVKSCRAFDEVCELVIPRIVAKKGVKQIVFAEADLADRMSRAGKLSPYKSLFWIVADPDPSAAQARLQLRNNMAGYMALRGTHSSTPSRQSWLEAARSKLGLTRSADNGPISASGENRQLLQTFLALRDSSDDPEIRRLLGKARAIAVSDNFSRLKQGVLLLACAKLREPCDAQDVIFLATPECKANLWWKDAAIAVTRNWIQSKEPSDWVRSLCAIDLEVLQEVARQDRESYTALRSEMLGVMGSDATSSMLPFETFEEDQESSGHFRKLQGILEEGARRAARAQTPSENDWSWQLDVSTFYTTLTILPLFSRDITLRLLARAKDLWGESARQSQAESSVYLRAGELDSADRACREWFAFAPMDPDAWFQDGEIKRERRNAEAACESYLRSAELAEKKGAARLAAARCLWFLNRDDEAATQLQAVLEDGHDAEASVFLGRIRAAHGDYSTALTIFKALKIEEINEYVGLVPYLYCLTMVESWESTKTEFERHFDKLSEDELRWYISIACPMLHGKGMASAACDTFGPLLMFTQEWEAAVSSVGTCCLAASNFALAEAIFEICRDCEWMSEALYMDFSRIHMYAPNFGASSLRRSFEIAIDGLSKFPTSSMLNNQAGESAAFAGQSGDSYFCRTIELINAVGATNQGAFDYLQLAIAHCNLRQFENAQTEIERSIFVDDQFSSRLYKTVIVCASDGMNAQQICSDPEQLNFSRSPAHLENLRCHMVDLELYQRRGLITDTGSSGALRQDDLKARMAGPAGVGSNG